MKEDNRKDDLKGLYVNCGRKTVLQESVEGSDGSRSVILFNSSMIVAEGSVLTKVSSVAWGVLDHHITCQQRG